MAYYTIPEIRALIESESWPGQMRASLALSEWMLANAYSRELVIEDPESLVFGFLERLLTGAAKWKVDEPFVFAFKRHAVNWFRNLGRRSANGNVEFDDEYGYVHRQTPFPKPSPELQQMVGRLSREGQALVERIWLGMPATEIMKDLKWTRHKYNFVRQQVALQCMRCLPMAKDMKNNVGVSKEQCDDERS